MIKLRAGNTFSVDIKCLQRLAKILCKNMGCVLTKYGIILHAMFLIIISGFLPE